MWLRSATLPDSERCKVQNALVDVLAWTSLMNNASMTSCGFFFVVVKSELIGFRGCSMCLR
jgi:hypothetical protein